MGSIFMIKNHQRRQHKLNCLPPADYRSLLEAA